MFEPPLALASLSGRSDARWAAAGAPHAGAALLGGVSLDGPTRRAARCLVERERTEFLPADPVAFVAAQLAALEGRPIRPGVNVRAVTREPLRRVGRCCRRHGALLEINAHCRQSEMCAVGAGETLLGDPARLGRFVEAAAGTGATVGVKVRAEVPGVDLAHLARAVAGAGADYVHVDAMDTPSSVRAVSEAADLFVIANNGVRDRRSVMAYLERGADAVSVGRASDDPAVLERVGTALERARDRPVGPAGD